MLTPDSSRFALNCERWLADKPLMEMLQRHSDEHLTRMGELTDVNAMLREQGAYKSVHKIINDIEGAAKASEARRAAPQAVSGRVSF